MAAPPGTEKGGRKPVFFGENWCELWMGTGREWGGRAGEAEGEGEEEGEEEGGGVGAGGRGVSLMIGGLLLWEDLVSVACMGVMKFDWWCGWVLDGAPGEGHRGSRGV